ncbi:hypothetical protein AURDEDRAFT_63761 [Auricularia subglabra TFB-10046 SS5]|nr:hypothetical protein AURDEDRAFT_63761 [Auricularia subglabra TFB-10046 SS5]
MTIYTDASGVALAFYCPPLEIGFQSDLPERPPLEGPESEIFYDEALAVCSAIDWAASLTPRPKRLAVFSDSDNTVSMYNTLRAKPAYNGIIMHSVNTLLACNMQIRVVHIAGKDNVVADALSRRHNELARAIVPSITITDFTPPRITLGEAEE